MKQGLLAVVVLSSFAAVAHADDPPIGFYIGGSVGSATLELEDADSTTDFKADDTGFKLTAGYRILNWLAVEGGYADYGQPEDAVFGIDLRGDFQAFNVSAVALLPLGNVDLFGRIGIAAWEGSLSADRFGVEVSEDNVDPLIGLGIQYRAGRLAVRAEIEGLMLGFDDDGDDESDGDDWIDFASVGATWTF